MTNRKQNHRPFTMVVRRSAKRSLACVCAIAFASFWVNAEPKPLNRLSALDVTEDARTTTINVQLMSEPTFTVFRLDNPTRVFIDVANAELGSAPQRTDVRNGVVRTVTLEQLSEERQQTVRVVFELELNALYSVRGVGAAITVEFDNSQRIDVVAGRQQTTAPTVGPEQNELTQQRLEAAQALAEERGAELLEAKEKAQQNAVTIENLKRETADLKRSQKARLDAAGLRIRNAEARLETARKEMDRKLQDSQRQAEQAYQKADKSKSDAERRLSQAAAEAKVAEARAMKRAAEAAATSERLEKQALEAEERAQAAESELIAAKTRMTSLNEEIASRANDEVKRANQQVLQLKQEVALLQRQANAARDASERQSRVYTSKAEEAELRWQASVAREKDQKALNEQNEDRIRQLSLAASNAEREAQIFRDQVASTEEQLVAMRQERATERQGYLAKIDALQRRAKDTERLAIQRAAEAEARAAQAEARLKNTFGDKIAQAKADASRAQADLEKAQAEAQTARVAANSAESKALEAAQRSAELLGEAKLARAKVEQLANQLEGERNQRAIELAKSDARLKETAAEKAQLEEKLRRAELEAAQSTARIQSLLVGQKQLVSEANTLKHRKSVQEKTILVARQRAQAAELASEKAKAAQLEAEQKSQEMALKLNALQQTQAAQAQELEAQRSQENVRPEANGVVQRKIGALEDQLKAQKRESSRLSSAFEETQTALQAAQQAALEAQAEVAQARESARIAQLAADAEREKASVAQAQVQEARETARIAQQDAEKERARAVRARAEIEQARRDADAERAKADEARLAAQNAEERANAARLEADRQRQAALRAEEERQSTLSQLSETQERMSSVEQERNATIGQLTKTQQRAAEAEREKAETLARINEIERRAKNAEAQLESSQQVKKNAVSVAEATTSPTLSRQLPPPAVTPTKVVDVQFSSEPGFGRIQVKLSGTPVWSVRGQDESTQTLVIHNAEISPVLERTLDTADFGTDVKLVSSFQAPSIEREVHIVVTLGGTQSGQISEGNQQLNWRFATRASQDVAAYAQLPAPTWQVDSVSGTKTTVAPYTGLNAMSGAAAPQGPRGRRRFRGRKINVDIKDEDIHNVLRVLAKTGNVNIVTSDEVAGTVTMHLKLVPWDQALDMVLRTKGLDMVREGDIIRVAPMEMIAQEREAELKKQELKERLKPLEVKMITVNHANAQELIPRVSSVLSDRGGAEFDPRTNTVIVKDVDDHLDAAEDMIRRLDTQTPQVLIETRIVEVNEVNVKQLGIQWGMDSVWSAASGNPTGLRFPSSIGISGGADDLQSAVEGVSTNPNFVVNLPAAAGGGSGGALGLTFGSIDSTFNLNVRLSALENRGSVKIVSSPKITTLDNKVAKISQGVSIPISQVSATGVQTVFFDAVLLLQVQPHVTQDGNIYLKLRAENNTPDFQNVAARGDPTILKKEAQTELLLRDGDTTVIGGIYTSNAGVNSSEVPLLGSLPIIGAFFRNHQQSDRRTELLIFVTPRIVNRAAATVRTAR